MRIADHGLRISILNESAIRIPRSAFFVVLGLLVPVTAFAQSPDLQGVWSNAIVTPLERPAAFADKPFFTEAEAAEFLKPENIYARFRAVRDDVERTINTEIISESTEAEAKRVGADRRTSLIVDPPDGRLPARTPEARAKAIDSVISRPWRPADDPEDRTLSERCLMWGAGPPIIPLPYNNNVQIVQTRDYVMILNEMIHDVRIVPLDGRPHLPPSIRQWKGDPRGRWDGSTLVVETTNFTDKTTVEGSGRALRVVERFTRTGPDALRYEFTVEDPAFARQWSAAWTLTRADGRIFEYACHEGNYSMEMSLRGARTEEKK